MKVLASFLLAFILLSCGNRKEVVEATQPESPSWVQNRPVNPAYYTGIGIAPKMAGTNYHTTAKKNALSDLASEIKVKVNTNSLLYTLEDQSSFEQEFRESIRTSSNLNLEDFEIVDTWQDANSYWVYYRLNKAEYARALQQKKEAAQALALDFLSKADAANQKRDFATAADYYLRGLQAIEKFWNEENRVDYSNQSILLDNTLFVRLQDLLHNVRVEAEGQIELNFQNRYTYTAQLTVKNEGGHFLANVPLLYEYAGSYGRVRNRIKSNGDGKIEIQIANAAKETSDNRLQVSINLESVFAPFRGDSFMRNLTQSMTGSESQIPIRYKPPVVYLECIEKNLGKPMEKKPLEAAISTSLNRHGVLLTNKRNEADLVMKIVADTEKSGKAKGFYSAQLTFNLSVKDSATGQNRFQMSRLDVKGVDLTFEKAGIQAYQNLTRNIESELMRTLINSIL